MRAVLPYVSGSRKVTSAVTPNTSTDTVTNTPKNSPSVNDTFELRSGTGRKSGKAVRLQEMVSNAERLPRYVNAR